MESNGALVMNDQERTATRLPFGGWTQDEVELLVERISERVMANFYEEVGKAVVKRMMQVIGIATVVIMMWIAGKHVVNIWGDFK